MHIQYTYTFHKRDNTLRRIREYTFLYINKYKLFLQNVIKDICEDILYIWYGRPGGAKW